VIGHRNMARTVSFASCVASALSSEVYVMLGLDTVTNAGTLKDASKLGSQLDQLKSAGVDGFMTDVWWGLTEPSPQSYNFNAYKEMVSMAKARDLKIQMVSSFHQCGGNVGDDCDIPLPSWATSVSGIWYKDSHGFENKEYISLFADNVGVNGRTPLQIYGDWFNALASTFSSDIGSTIVEVQVGMGPAGQLRYPSYQLQFWSFCGVGEFQVWDSHALSSFQAATAAAGHSEWDSPPSDAGSYNSRPSDTGFFGGGYSSEYGKVFLGWYFDSLKTHGSNVLGAAKSAFGNKLAIAGKVSGVHWWYNTASHAAELTAGYYNANGRDAYSEIADVFKSHGAALDFTCLEMRDSEQDSSCASSPENLVKQVLNAVNSKSLTFNGENALPRYDNTAYNQILSYSNNLHAFTYLRLGDTLLSSNNFNTFRSFVGNMHSQHFDNSSQVEV